MGAQDQLAMADRADPGAGGAEHAAGSYTGVKLGGEQAPPGARRRGKAAVAVTWPGFQMRPDGGSCVFLQTTAPLSVQPVKGEHKWVIDLGEVRVEGTNRLPLDTHYFNTPVTRVVLKQSRQRTLLELAVRADVAPRVTVTHAKNGYHFLSLEFAPGQYLPAELQSVVSANVAPPPPSKPEPGNSASNPAQSGRPTQRALEYNDDAAASADAQAQTAAATASAAKLEAEVAAELNAELPPGMAPVKRSQATTKIGASASGRAGR